MFRLIDFRRNKDGVPAVVHSIQYDPNRSARIALLHYVDGEKRYILSPAGLEAGQKVHERSRCSADRSAIACRCGTFLWARRFIASSFSRDAAA